MSIGNINSPAPSTPNSSSNFLNSSMTSTLTPKQARGIYGWEFDAPAEEDVTLDSESADYYTEDGFARQDHAVNKPAVIRLTGFIGELVYRAPAADSPVGLLNTAAGGLGQLNGYLGNQSPQAIQTANGIASQAKTIASQINQVVSAAQNSVGLLGKLSGTQKTKAEIAFGQLSALRDSKTICTVQTPWKYYETCQITQIHFVRRELEIDIVDIDVTLKELRLTGATYTSFNESLFANPADAQATPDESAGPVNTGPSGSYAFQMLTGRQN